MILHAAITATNPASISTVLVMPAFWAGMLATGLVHQPESGVEP